MKIQRWGKYEKTKGMLRVTHHYTFIRRSNPNTQPVHSHPKHEAFPTLIEPVFARTAATPLHLSDTALKVCTLCPCAATSRVATPPGMAGAFSLSEESTEKDPWLCVMHALHVGVRTEALPCCTEEYGRVMRAVEELLEEGSGGCVCPSFCCQ
jgi:hypothetical protein